MLARRSIQTKAVRGFANNVSRGQSDKMQPRSWNYPTPIRFGPGRIKELSDACKYVSPHLTNLALRRLTFLCLKGALDEATADYHGSWACQPSNDCGENCSPRLMLCPVSLKFLICRCFRLLKSHASRLDYQLLFFRRKTEPFFSCPTPTYDALPSFSCRHARSIMSPVSRGRCPCAWH